MTYMKPEMDIEKFDIVENITADGTSVATGGNDAGAVKADSAAQAVESIGSDLIIG